MARQDQVRGKPICVPATDLGMAEREWVEWSLRITSALSAVGCMYVIVRYMLGRSRADRNVTSMLVVALAVFELMIAIAKAPATQFIVFQLDSMTHDTWVKAAIQPPLEASLCQVQGYLIQVFMLQAVLWNNCMAYNLLRWVVYRDTEEALQSRFWLYLFATSTFSVVWGLGAALPVWTLHSETPVSMFGFARFFCWMQYPDVSIWGFISFVLVTLGYTAALMIKIRRVVVARAKQNAAMATIDTDVDAIQRRLFLYVFAFFILHAPPVLYRVILYVAQNAAKNDPIDKNAPHQCALAAVNIFGIVAQIWINLQGFVNALIYSGFIRSPNCPLLQRDGSVLLSGHLPPPSIYLEEVGSTASGAASPTTSERISIFASTFNMAEGAVPPDDQLEMWIPKGHDVYVIGVQECLNLVPMRHAMAAHIQRINGKPFVEYGREIGRTEKVLGFHGFIAITVYVASADVHAGHFHMHLEASSKGKSKIKKRHQDGSNILTNMHLQSIDNEFDCHLMAHHTIFMGDLNYRLTALDATPDRILNMIAAVVNSHLSNSTIKRGQVFASAPGPHAMPGARRNMFLSEPAAIVDTRPSCIRVPSDDRHDAMSSTPSIASSSAASMSWRHLLEHDELKQCMDEGVIFTDFDEAQITFPPTYRRVLHRMLNPHAVATTTDIADLYTTVLTDGRVRVPSYTDRILYHSLPKLQDRFACVQYTSAEYIGTSDHKPVSCVFEVVVEKGPGAGAAAMAPHTSLLPCNVRGTPVKALTVHLTCLELTWGPVLEKFMTDNGDDDWSVSDDDGSSSHGGRAYSVASWSGAPFQSANTTPKPIMEGLPVPPSSTVHGNRLRVRSLFPLPCEDDFAEERKLAELADHFQGPFSTRNERKLVPAWKLSPWKTLADHGLKQTVVLPASRRHVHVALSFILPSGFSAGQCVVSLMDASHRMGRQVDFEAVVTLGGRRAGLLAGKVSLFVDAAVAMDVAQ
ncbi:hypothetical protein H310_11010 [Aphanomyces invadans]|uniref:G-protein coupled receptors family 1 profile domain-containing protein n=1 Tax=Aphanomyces invadans TaxID=157072 RepID=A0A024TPK9_9STRA|nr:hypothetical protein H310_11010 [Aphanomyces invadans]ETV95571.1 hypothetical protein H310_11010 [Aphanomyces invadans]|eukprot:XP_008875764.1 hypothetical protein H310_11010 [Aphanomyces invadans]